MSKRYIRIELDGEEGATVEAMGFKGKACALAVAAFSKLFGRTKKSVHKKEYHLREQVKLNRG
jgi:hypothetical protein